MVGGVKVGEWIVGMSFWREATNESPEIPAPTTRIFLLEMKRGEVVEEEKDIFNCGDGYTIAFDGA
jgi:hypothetical protein